jgi:hypothetical protein
MPHFHDAKPTRTSRATKTVTEHTALVPDARHHRVPNHCPRSQPTPTHSATLAMVDRGFANISTDISYLPDLERHLADLLRNRQRLLATVDADE